MGLVRRLRCMDRGDEPSYGLGTGHHTLCLHLATDISKVPIVRIGVNMHMYCQ